MECEDSVESSLREKKSEVGRMRKREGAVRRSPRAHLKRGRQAEGEEDDVSQKEREKERVREKEKEGEKQKEREGEKERKGEGKGEGGSYKDSQKSCTEKDGPKVGDGVKRKILATGEDESRSEYTIKPARHQKARKAIKYLDDSEDESEFVERGKDGERGKKEQAILTTSATSGRSLGLASPSKKAVSSQHRQTTPDREEYLVKQPGLTFDKEKSASPIKPARKDGSSTGVNIPSSPVAKLTRKAVSSPAKLDSKSSPKPVAPVSKPVSKSVKPASTAGATTPSGTPKPSRASSYRNYMNRGGPKAPGSKVVPEGEENCFEGLTFVITGVLDSLEREEAADIVKRSELCVYTCVCTTAVHVC